jgi:nitroreductase
MEFYEVLRRRRSIRAYAQEAVPEATLKLLFEAVSLAPSACNNQPVRFLFVTDLAVRRRLCECYPRDWLAGAPVLVVALGNRETAWRRFNGQSAHVIDAAIAMEHLVLAAAAEGLGTCWICAFDQDQARQALRLPDCWEVVALTPLGRPAAEPAPQTRKPLAEIIERLA